MGDVELFDGPVARYVDATGVPLLSVDYRVAPEHPHPVPVDDCYLGLRWLADHAGELGVDPARIAVMGDSAGAGLAAAVALMARDRGGPQIARQVLCTRCSTTALWCQTQPSPRSPSGPTTTTSRGGPPCWETGPAATARRRMPHRRARATWAACRRCTSRSASWTSSATRGLTTCAAPPTPGRRSSSTSGRACRTTSTRWRPTATSRAGAYADRVRVLRSL